MKHHFGTDGIRGTVGNYPITPDFAMHLAYAIGIVLKKLSNQANNEPITVIIGKDTRISGYLFEASLEAGFSYAGINVLLVGPIPTPAIAFLTTKLNLTMGVIISASHNPYYDNGIKFFSDQGLKLSDEVELAIEKQFLEPMIMASSLGNVKRINDAHELYINFCLNSISNTYNHKNYNKISNHGAPSIVDFLKTLKIVVDCANGANYHVVPQIFKQLNIDIIKVACEPNGVNINENCGSTHIDYIIDMVKVHQADYGIAFDGDGDRVIFVDSESNIFNGDKLLYILVKLYLAQNIPVKTVIGTVMTNLAMEKVLKQQNIMLTRTQVGDKYVMQALHQHKAILGGESSGHILCLDKHSTGDGIIVALQILNAMFILKNPLKKIVDWIDYPQQTFNIKIDQLHNNWQAIANEMIDTFVSTLKGKGRIVIRKSGTEPIVRIMVEAYEMNIVEYWIEHIATSILK